MLQQIERIKSVQSKIDLYDSIIRSKLEYDLQILIRLAQLDQAMSNFSYQEDQAMSKQENIISPNYYDLPEAMEVTETQEEQPETVPMLEILEPSVIHTVKLKRGRPKKKRN